MIVEKAFVNARGVDSYPFSLGGTLEQAMALKARGVDFFVGYLGSMNVVRLSYVLDAGLAFMPVTTAGEYFDGAGDEVAALDALGIPDGCTVWLDLEGQKTFNTDISKLTQLVRDWAAAISKRWIPGLYVGSPQPFTGPELAALPVFRYWCAASRVQDRYGRIWDEPEGCGFCMRQGWPQGTFLDTGVFVDGDWITSDRKQRVPTWVRK